MRVASNSIYTHLLNSLNSVQTQEQNDLTQLSTNRRVNSPSDDPTAAALEVKNLSSTADAAQYQTNITSTQTLLQSAKSALNSVVTTLNSAITDGTSAAGGTLTSAQQSQLATTVSGLRDQILSLANTEVSGVYVFGGTKSSTKPFTLDSTSSSGVAYNGNSGVNTVQVTDSESVQANTPGDQIFMNSSGNVMQSLNDMITAMQSGDTSAIGTAVTEVTSALNTVSLQEQNYSSSLTRLSSDSTYLSNETVTLKSQENDLVGADTASVITELTQAQTTQQATLQAAAKVMPMTLLNYLG